MQNKKPSVGGVWIFSGTTQYMYWFLWLVHGKETKVRWASS